MDIGPAERSSIGLSLNCAGSGPPSASASRSAFDRSSSGRRAAGIGIACS